MNKLPCIIVLLLLATLSVTAQQETPPIRNFLRVNEEFCTGAQPRLEHLEKLKAEGVRAVINLRPRGEHRAEEEEAKAKELGLRYFQIPVAFGGPKEERAENRTPKPVSLTRKISLRCPHQATVMKTRSAQGHQTAATVPVPA